MDWTRLSLSTLSAGLIAGTGAVLTAVSDGNSPSAAQWIITGAVTLGAAAKDIQAFLADSPRQNS